MRNPMNGTEKMIKLIKDTKKKRCFLGTVSFFLGCDFRGLILYLGFWGLDFEILMEKIEKKRERKQKKQDEKVDCLQGANPVSPQGEGPPRGNSRVFFLTFWDVMGNPMNGTEKMIKLIKATKKNRCFLGTVSFLGGCDFRGLILYLGFWGLDFEILMEKIEKKRERKPKKKGRKSRLPTGG